MKTYINKLYTYFLILMTLIFTLSCSDDELPAEENEEEAITDVKLIFTNQYDANDVVVARAQDPDAGGVEELKVLDGILLGINKQYTLTFEIMNNLESPGEDIGEEILEEGDEHQIFFDYPAEAFCEFGYGDTDANGNPIGLITHWQNCGTQVSEKNFTVKLQHQPDIKTSTTGPNDGDTDFELTFVLTIQ